MQWLSGPATLVRVRARASSRQERARVSEWRPRPALAELWAGSLGEGPFQVCCVLSLPLPPDSLSSSCTSARSPRSARPAHSCVPAWRCLGAAIQRCRTGPALPALGRLRLPLSQPSPGAPCRRASRSASWGEMDVRAFPRSSRRAPAARLRALARC